MLREKTFCRNLVHVFVLSSVCKLHHLLPTKQTTYELLHLARHFVLLSLLRLGHFVLFVELLVLVVSSTTDSVMDVKRAFLSDPASLHRITLLQHFSLECRVHIACAAPHKARNLSHDVTHLVARCYILHHCLRDKDLENSAAAP